VITARLPLIFGRYALHDEIAAGGMATVHLGRLLGPAGFARTVAVKRLHAHLATDREFVSMFLDEARLAARISHPNVVATLDVVSTDSEVFLVMEYVRGESLSRLIREQTERMAPAMAAALMSGVLHGLHAAHEAKNERGVPLGLVHRDVSPQNILVGADGVARVLDFGVAKALGRLQTTRDGQIKGKLAYMAPEQTRGFTARTTDVYAASVVLWEALTGRRLFGADSDGETLRRVLEARVVAPSQVAADVPSALDAAVMRGLHPEAAERFQTARDMAMALEEAVPLVAASRIGSWVEAAAAHRLMERDRLVWQIENDATAPPSTSRAGSRVDVPEAIRDEGANPTKVWSTPTPASRLRPGRAVAARGTWVVSLPEPISPVTRVRGMLLVASREQLRSMQRYDEYQRFLTPGSRSALDEITAASWIPLDLARCHFEAVERLELDTALVESNTAAVADKVTGILLSTVVRAARVSGITPLATIRTAARLWRRIFDGGAVGVSQVAPKELFVFFSGNPLLSYRYHRTGTRMHLTNIVTPLSERAAITEHTFDPLAHELVLRVQWV
jgi:serine/threonine protein kinase